MDKLLEAVIAYSLIVCSSFLCVGRRIGKTRYGMDEYIYENPILEDFFKLILVHHTVAIMSQNTKYTAKSKFYKTRDILHQIPAKRKFLSLSS